MKDACPASSGDHYLGWCRWLDSTYSIRFDVGANMAATQPPPAHRPPLRLHSPTLRPRRSQARGKPIDYSEGAAQLPIVGRGKLSTGRIPVCGRPIAPVLRHGNDIGYVGNPGTARKGRASRGAAPSSASECVLRNLLAASGSPSAISRRTAGSEKL